MRYLAILLLLLSGCNKSSPSVRAIMIGDVLDVKKELLEDARLHCSIRVDNIITVMLKNGEPIVDLPPAICGLCTCRVIKGKSDTPTLISKYACYDLRHLESSAFFQRWY